MAQYYNTQTFQRVEIDPAMVAIWTANGNPKATLFQPLPAPPAYNAVTQRVEWGNAGWQVVNLTAEEVAEMTLKKWESPFEFFTEFTTSELNALLSSTNASIRVRRFLLSIWNKPLRSDSARMQDLLNDLVTATIITAQRKAEIIAP